MPDNQLAALALPWRVLATPAATFGQLAARPPLWPCIFTEWVLLALGTLVATRPLGELLVASGLAETAAPRVAGLPVTVSLLLAVLGFNLLLGLLGYLVIRLLSIALPLSKVLAWAAYAHFPIVLGRTLALLIFAITAPLADTPAQALTLQLSPAAFGLAPLFTPLTYPWVCAIFFDAFGLWTLVLLAIGARRLLGATPARTAWLLGSMVLLWLLVLTGAWQSLQSQALGTV